VFRYLFFLHKVKLFCHSSTRSPPNLTHSLEFTRVNKKVLCSEMAFTSSVLQQSSSSTTRAAICASSSSPKKSSNLTVKRTSRGRKVTATVMASSSNKVEPAIIIGGGRVGQALFDMGVEGDVIVKRDDEFPSSPSSGPIFVCTRNDVLETVIEKTPANRREDLIFMQNGYLDSFLQSKGLEKNTQALIYFAVAKFGEKPTDGVTSVNPEGLTAVTGKWSDQVAARFHNGDLSCHVKDAAKYRASMLEKLIWISAFMLVGAQHPGATVGDVATTHKSEVEGLIKELVQGVADINDVTFEAGTLERLLAYADSVAHFPTAVKEFEWRNGFFYNLSTQTMQQSKDDPFPKHTAMLKAINAI